MIKKMGSFIMSLVLLVAFAGCGQSQNAATSPSSPASVSSSAVENNMPSADMVSISLLNSKGEIQAALEGVAAQYGELHPNVKLEVIPCPVGTSPFEKISTLYNSGNPPTMAMLDAVDVAAIAPEKGLDLSDEKWVQDAGSMIVPIDGKIYGFTFGAEARGLIYNATTIKNIIPDFDPAAINTRTALSDLFTKLSAAGTSPMLISKDDWSLGNHLMTLIYFVRSENLRDEETFLNDLKAGKVDLANDALFNGFCDTFELLRANNYFKDDPLSANYDTDPMPLAEGETAMWFNGVWTWANIKQFDTGSDYAFMPVPISDNASDFGNTRVVNEITKLIMVDNVIATPEQQQAAKDFLNWLVYDNAGQDAYVNKLGMVPPYANINLEPGDPLGRSQKAYTANGKVAGTVLIPSDHWSILGVPMQKYLDGKIDRNELAKEIEKYWADHAG